MLSWVSNYGLYLYWRREAMCASSRWPGGWRRQRVQPGGPGGNTPSAGAKAEREGEAPGTGTLAVESYVGSKVQSGGRVQLHNN